MISKLKSFYNKYLSWISSYWLVTIGFLVLMSLDQENNLWMRLAYEKKISELESEIEILEEKIEEDRKKLEDMLLDKEGLETFAREQYFMKKGNEDVFIIEE